jgi:hypothetical protein
MAETGLQCARLQNHQGQVTPPSHSDRREGHPQPSRSGWHGRNAVLDQTNVTNTGPREECYDSAPVRRPEASEFRVDARRPLLAHWTVMPSRRIIATNPVMEKKIAMAVSPYVTTERSRTNERSDDETSNQNTSPALMSKTLAQRTEIRMKNRRTKGRLMIAGSMGQKS